MASSGDTVHTQLAALTESVNSNGSSAVADVGDPVVSSAVAVSQSSPPPTGGQSNVDDEPQPQEWDII